MPNGNGQWSKKINGKVYWFGTWQQKVDTRELGPRTSGSRSERGAGGRDLAGIGPAAA